MDGERGGEIIVPKFRVYGTYSVSVSLGVVEAEGVGPAEEMAANKYEGDSKNLCYQCNSEFGDAPTCHAFFAEPAGDDEPIAWDDDSDDEDEAQLITALENTKGQMLAREEKS